MSNSLVRGWCPGARRPMRSGDGLILRLRITGGRLAREVARAIADVAARYGNGELDLGRRGGLQLRGIHDETFGAVETALSELGLLDDDAGAEAIRNVVASPLSDLDEAAKGDVLTVARRLEKALVADDALQALPAKFGFSIDDGGRFSLAGVPADVRLRFVSGGLTISVAGDERAAVVQSEEVVPATLRLAQAFLLLSPCIDHPSPRRMATLVKHLGADAVFAAAGLEPTVKIPEEHPGSAPLIGAFPAYVGVGLPFGRIDADRLRFLADVAVSDIRLTPFRAVLLPAVSAGVLPSLADAGFITSPNDPLLSVTACSGAPACSSANIETRDLAHRLATLKTGAHGVWLHISGCEKGCASSSAHAVTLVGRDGGLDLVLDGGPTDPPCHKSLSPEAVEALLRSGTI